MSAEVLELDYPQLIDLMSASAKYTLLEDGVQNIAGNPFDDDEIQALLKLPQEHSMRLTLRLVELAEDLREALRELDTRLLLLAPRHQGAKGS